MKMLQRSFILLMLVIVASCAQLGLVPAKTFTEQVAYTEAGIQGSIKTLMDLTCTEYTVAGVCVAANRPIHPAQASLYLDHLTRARQATKAAGSMSASGGQCLGQRSSPAECLALANVLLSDIAKALTEAQKKGK